MNSNIYTGYFNLSRNKIERDSSQIFELHCTKCYAYRIYDKKKITKALNYLNHLTKKNTRTSNYRKK